ncbi:MAG: MauE/DoxX family redox-associated membrane protein [Syntrophobacteraceae bacterium]
MARDFFVLSPWPYRMLRLGIALLFIWAGTGKLLHPKAFATAIANYEILPDALIVYAALGVPALEVLAGLGLLLDVTFGFRLTFGLLVLFMGVLAYAMLSGLDIDCGCYSADEIRERNSLQITFIRDVALAASVLFLFYCRRVRARTTLDSILLDRRET